MNIIKLLLLFIGACMFTASVFAHEHSHDHPLSEPIAGSQAKTQETDTFSPMTIPMLHGVRNLKQNIHPIVVHFPIGLLGASFLFYVVGLSTRHESLLQTGKWTIFAGTAGALAAVLTGVWAGNIVAHDEMTHAIMEWHEYLGFGVLSIGVLLSFWLLLTKTVIPKKGTWAFITLFTVLILLLIQQTDLGGQLVFLYGVGILKGGSQ